MIISEHTNQPDADNKIGLRKNPKVRAILRGARERVSKFPQLRKKVSEAEPLSDFDFVVLQGEDGRGEYQRIINSEPEVTQVIELPFAVDSEKYYSFLKSLQDIGFDLFALLSMPKGEVFSVTHGSLPNLTKFLEQRSVMVSRHQEIHNKLIKRDLKEGQLHVRIYAGNGKTYLTAHIDPPDLKDHLSPSTQLSGQTKANYPEGEAMLIETLQVIAHLGET